MKESSAIQHLPQPIHGRGSLSTVRLRLSYASTVFANTSLSETQLDIDPATPPFWPYIGLNNQVTSGLSWSFALPDQPIACSTSNEQRRWLRLKCDETIPFGSQQECHAREYHRRQILNARDLLVIQTVGKCGQDICKRW